MIFRIIAVLAFVGGALAGVATTNACVTQEAIAGMNNTVDDLDSQLSSMMSDPPTPEEIHAILDLVCSDNTILTLMEGMQTTVGLCPALIAATKLKDLKLGSLQFTDLFVKFLSVQNFCDCVPSLLGVMTIEAVKEQIEYHDMNAKYHHVLNFPFMCSPPSQLNINMTDVLMTLKAHVTTCPNVFDYNTVFTKTNIIQAAYLHTKCSNMAQDNFNCGMNLSKTDNYKACIASVDGTASDDDKSKQCGHTDCVNKNMMSCSKEARDIYLWSVEIKNKDTFRLTDDCSAAASVTVSIIFMISAAIFSVFFTY